MNWHLCKSRSRTKHLRGEKKESLLKYELGRVLGQAASRFDRPDLEEVVVAAGGQVATVGRPSEAADLENQNLVIINILTRTPNDKTQ